MPLNDETIQRLIAVRDKPKTRTGVANPAIGPLRYIGDNRVPRHCSQRGCMSPANYAVQGAPKCSVHALGELNEMLVGQGFKGVATVATARPTPVPSGRQCTSSTLARLAVGFGLQHVQCIHSIPLEKECRDCLVED